MESEIKDVDFQYKSGYLNEDFLLFHIKDKVNKEFDFHYHDFNKIIIFLSGKVTYLIEGKTYYLKPWDILLVNNHDLHKPIIDSCESYERIIIWINLKFLEAYNYDKCDLQTCFNLVNEKRINLIRLSKDAENRLRTLILMLEASLKSKEFGSELLSKTLFIQLIIYLNRLYMGEDYLKDSKALKYDPQIDRLLKYINENLNKKLSIEELAQKFYLSRYYLMHKFKAETGYTIHSYINQKKLIMAAERIREGQDINKAAYDCGFTDYSTFLRAFKRMFNKSPKDFINKT